MITAELGFTQIMAGVFSATDQGLPRTRWSNSVGLGRQRELVLLEGLLQFWKRQLRRGLFFARGIGQGLMCIRASPSPGSL